LKWTWQAAVEQNAWDIFIARLGEVNANAYQNLTMSMTAPFKNQEIRLE